MTAAFDVVVVGGGLAGRMAALSAADAGRRVLLIESGRSRLGEGNTRMASGSFMAGGLSPAAAPPLLLERALGTGVAVPELAAVWAAHAERALQRLRDAGVAVQVDPTGHHWLEHRSRIAGGPVHLADVGRRILSKLDRAHRDRGGRVRWGERVTSLELPPEGGVVVRSARGTVRGSCVVVASGGFSANRRLIARHVGASAAASQLRCSPACRGDALEMLTALGADTINLQYFYGHLMARGSLHDDRLWPYPRLDPLIDHGMLVDESGDRFVDEGLGDVALSNIVARRKNPAECVLVFGDAAWHADANRLVAPLGLPNVRDAESRFGADLVTGADAHELALRLGVDPHRLERTITRLGEGADEVPRTGPRPVLSGPLWGIRVVPGVSSTMGGVRVDGGLRVLDTTGSPLSGVHAAGDAIGGLMGGAAGGYLGGLLQAAVTGLVAGASAARTSTPTPLEKRVP